MPSTLHPHLQLKRSGDADHYDGVDPEDLLEDLPSCYHDPQLQAAKRRRVEAIALQYHRARTPFILSAGLKGPFDKGWKNPWAEKAQGSRRMQSPHTETSSNKTRGAVDRRARSRDNHARAQRTTMQSLQVPVAKDAERKSQTSQTRSPEASRAAEDNSMHREHTQSLDDLEVPPATVSLLEEHSTSSATECFSASIGEYIQPRSPLSNPFWLRRPVSQRRVNVNQPTSSATDTSPIRSRNSNAQHSLGRERYLASPKLPLHRQRLPTKEVVPEDWRSSASASMIISSPAEPVADNDDHTAPSIITSFAQPIELAHADISSSARHRADSAQEEDDTLSRSSQSAQHPEAAIFCHTPATVQTDSNTLSPRTQNTGNIQMLVPATVYRTSASVQSIGQPVNAMLLSGTSTRHGQKRASSQEPSSQQLVQHDLAASPALASSTGFTYRKMGNPKTKSSNPLKPKPRAMNFSSPPAMTRDAHASTKQIPHNLDAIQEISVVEQDVGATIDGAEVEEVGDVEKNDTEEEGGRQSSHSSRNSIYSTQAAMLLAQLEFQEGTFPTMSSETPRPWTQPQDDTPQPNVPEPGFAITPFSVFKASLNKSHPPESVIRGPPISTQDLFTAVSPFAFSTTKKKKNEQPQQSSLRFALLPRYDEESRVDGSPAKSPTPAVDRVRLKEKNTTTSFWSFVSEKTSQASQESSMKHSRELVSDKELPQLDLYTSLDDYSLSSHLLFTDRSLRNLNNT